MPAEAQTDWPDNTVWPWRAAVSATRGDGTEDQAEHLASSFDTLAEEQARGVFIGQVAQLEDLLRHIAHHSEHRLAGRAVPKTPPPVAGFDALAHTLTALHATGPVPAGALTALVESALALRRRDNLITAQFTAAYSTPPDPQAAPIPVITLMSSADRPLCDGDGVDDVNETDLGEYLIHAQHALDLLAGLWAELDRALPTAMP